MKKQNMSKATELYSDTSTDELKTFVEVRNDYMKSTNTSLPISYDDMQKIIFDNLYQNGGNIISIDDDILKWCNDYMDYCDSFSPVSQSERDSQVKEMYQHLDYFDCLVDDLRNILEKDMEVSKSKKESEELLNRLNAIIFMS